MKEPKYRKLYNELRIRLMSGEFAPGDLIPSENELKEQYKITQPTVRHALNILVQEKLIKKHHGKGSIVQPRPVGVGIISFEGPSATSQVDNPNIRTRVIKGPEIADWPCRMYFNVNEERERGKAIIIERIRTLDNKVVFYERLLIPEGNMRRLLGMNLNNTSFYDLLLNEFGIMVTSSQQKIWALAAGSVIGKKLRVRKTRPIIRMERKFETNRNNFNIYSSFWANTKNYLLYSQS